MKEKYFWLLIILIILMFLSSPKIYAKNRLELSYQSINRDLPYYQMTIAPVDPHNISRMGTAIFDHSQSTGQTIRYSHFTQFRNRPVEIQLSLGKEQAEGSWNLRELGGYWYGESDNLDSISTRAIFTYFLSPSLGLKAGFARENLNHEGFAADNRPSWLRGDWTRKEEKNRLILGIEKDLLKNLKLGCTYTPIWQTQDFEFSLDITTDRRWWKAWGDGRFEGDGWNFKVTYLPKDFLQLRLLSGFEDGNGNLECTEVISGGQEHRDVFRTSTNSLKKSEYDLAADLFLTKRLCLNLSYFVNNYNQTYEYLDNDRLDYQLQKNGWRCGFEWLISSGLKFKTIYSHANFKREDNWYYFSEEAPSWEGKGEEDKINLGWIFEF